MGKHYILKSSCRHQGAGNRIRSDSPFVYTGVSKRNQTNMLHLSDKTWQRFQWMLDTDTGALVLLTLGGGMPAPHGRHISSVMPNLINYCEMQALHLTAGCCLHLASRTDLAHVLLSWSRGNATSLYILILLCTELRAELGSIQTLILKQRESHFNSPKARSLVHAPRVPLRSVERDSNP